MVWFQVTYTISYGYGVDIGVYLELAGTPGSTTGQTQIGSFNNAPPGASPGLSATTVVGQYQVTSLATYHGFMTEGRTHNSLCWSTQSITMLIETGPTNAGPWTTYATSTSPPSDCASGWYNYLWVDMGPAFGPPPPDCQYGTRAKSGHPALDILEAAKLIGILDAVGLQWWEVLLLVFAGMQLDVNALCSQLPPHPPTPTAEALAYPPYKLLEYLYAAVWSYYCECVPGVPSPTNPPQPTGTKPGDFPDNRTIVINPTNPCLDLTEVRRTLDAIMRQMNIDVQIDTLMQRYDMPFATVRGATHSGLSGEGSFAVSRLIGVQIVITSRIPGRELEGAPSYVWDLGWASMMDGNGFIAERRITRDVEVWLPRGFQEATTFGYSFKAGVVANVTELEAEV